MGRSVEDELASWRERALAAERWRDEVWLAVQEQAAQAQRADDLDRRLQELESSLSWRMTAPLRAAVAVVRRVRRRLARS
jgi:hypothetical protein